jgi:hypothetical protein
MVTSPDMLGRACHGRGAVLGLASRCGAFGEGFEGDAVVAGKWRSVVMLPKPDRQRNAVTLWEGVAGPTSTRPKVATECTNSAEERDLRPVERHLVGRGTIRYAHPRISVTPVQISCHRRCSDSS